MLTVRLRALRRAGDERGFALVMAIGSLAVLSLMLVVLVEYAAANSHYASRSSADQVAYSLAESGINDSESILNSNDSQGYSNALNATVLTGSNPCPDGTTRCLSVSYPEGAALYFGVFNAANETWAVTSWGKVRNPTGTAQPVYRKIGVSIGVVADPNQPANTAAWNYLYSTQTSNATTCDLDLQQSVTVDFSIYVAGNFCLDNTSNVQKPVSGDTVDIHVQGRIGLKNPSYPSGNFVGTSAAPVDDVRTPYGCMDGTNPLTHTPPHPCSSSTDQVWTTNYDTNPQVITSPISQSYWTNYYQTAQPGPKFACTSATGAVPVWDNDSTLDLSTNGSAGTFNLTPSTSYSCVVNSSGKTVGQLSWDASTDVLTVSGVVYFDGSMTVSNGLMNTYNGYGTIYLTGTFQESGGTTRLCAVAGSTDCNWSGTFGSSTQQEMLVIAANGNDGSGNSIDITQGAEFQGGLLGIHNINFGQGAEVQGGVIAPSENIGQSVVIRPLPVLQSLPLGAPGNPTTAATASSPIVTSG